MYSILSFTHIFSHGKIADILSNSYKSQQMDLINYKSLCYFFPSFESVLSGSPNKRTIFLPKIKAIVTPTTTPIETP